MDKMSGAASAGNVYSGTAQIRTAGITQAICRSVPYDDPRNVVVCRPFIPARNTNVIIFEPVNIIVGDFKNNRIAGTEANIIALSAGTCHNYALVHKIRR